MKSFLATIALSVTLFAAGSAHAQEQYHWTMKEIANPATLPEMTDPVLRNQKALPQVDGDINIGDIVNVLKQVWQVIQENKPVADVQFDYANAIPRGADSANDLAGFSDLQAKSYQVTLVNGFGQKVVELEYTLLHMFGGNVAGKGRYLENVTVLPSKVNVMWGYKLNMGVKKITTVNVGTAADPVAGLVMQLEYIVKSPFKEMQSRAAFQFRGDVSDVRAIQ